MNSLKGLQESWIQFTQQDHLKGYPPRIFIEYIKSWLMRVYKLENILVEVLGHQFLKTPGLNGFFWLNMHHPERWQSSLRMCSETGTGNAFFIYLNILSGASHRQQTNSIGYPLSYLNRISKLTHHISYGVIISEQVTLWCNREY